MYVQEIFIDICSDIDRNEAIEEFDLLMAYYRDAGVIQWEIQSEFIAKNVLRTFPYTHERDSLLNVFDDFYVRQQTERLERLCDSKIRFRTVGTTRFDRLGTVCECRNGNFYVLFTNYVSIVSPLMCGICNEPIPLYKIPVFEDHGYVPILNWQSNYQSCDTLQMNCEVGESWATEQMQNPESELSKQGRRICSKIETLTSAPTYYYLYNCRSISENEDRLRPCPNCWGKWLIDNPTELYWLIMCFKCDQCRLISHATLSSCID